MFEAVRWWPLTQLSSAGLDMERWGPVVQVGLFPASPISLVCFINFFRMALLPIYIYIEYIHFVSFLWCKKWWITFLLKIMTLCAFLTGLEWMWFGLYHCSFYICVYIYNTYYYKNMYNYDLWKNTCIMIFILKWWIGLESFPC